MVLWAEAPNQQKQNKTNSEWHRSYSNSSFILEYLLASRRFTIPKDSPWNYLSNGVFRDFVRRLEVKIGVIMILVLGTWYLVLDVGTCCDRHDLLNTMVLVSSHFDSGTWYLVFGTWYLVLGTWCGYSLWSPWPAEHDGVEFISLRLPVLILTLGTWYLVLGTWNRYLLWSPWPAEYDGVCFISLRPPVLILTCCDFFGWFLFGTRTCSAGRSRHSHGRLGCDNGRGWIKYF